MTGVRKEYKNLSDKQRQHSRILLLDKNGDLLPDYTASTVEPEHYITLLFRPGLTIKPLTGICYTCDGHDIPAVAQFIDYERPDNLATATGGNILLRDKGKCYLTGHDFSEADQFLAYADELTIDHVRSLAKGGRDKDMRNMALSHAHVNFLKGDMSVNEFREMFRKMNDVIHLTRTDGDNHPLFIKDDIPDQMPQPTIEALFLELLDQYPNACHSLWGDFINIPALRRKTAEHSFANRTIRHHTLKPTG